MPGHKRLEGVTTLRLPKGLVSTTSPARSLGTPGSRSSAELSSLSCSRDIWSQPSTIQLLQGIGVVELLEQDERPTFVVDLNDRANFAAASLQLVYVNPALRSAPALLKLLQVDAAEPGHNSDFSKFKAWVVRLLHDGPSSNQEASSITYAGFPWACSTLRRRFRVVRGYQTVAPGAASPAPLPSPATDLGSSEPWTGRRLEALRERSDYFGAASQSHIRAQSEPRSRAGSIVDTVVQPFDDLVLAPPQLRTTFDWTQIPIDDPNLDAHHRFARSIDWASTALGPVEGWPLELRIMSSMVMGSPHPAALYWGKDYVAIYNEAYISLAGQKHPRLMGSRYQDIWPEIWDEMHPVFEAARECGYATMKNDDALFISRHCPAEETFFSWSIIPLVGRDGTVVALYNPAFENTRRKIAERRMLTLREIGIRTAQARDVKGFWRQLQKALEYNELDVPFALLYSVREDSESEVSSLSSGNLAHLPQVVLEGSIGVPDGHLCAVPSIDLRSSDEGFAPHMRNSMAHSAGPIVLSEEDGTLPTELVQGISWRGFGDPCRTVVVFPVHPTTAGDAVVGFIVLGVNPRRPYDEDYQLFLNLLSLQLTTSLASVVLFEEEIRRGQNAARLAALDRQELSLQLHLRTQEAVESEYRFTRMAEFGPVGLFIADGHGHIDYCNEMWYRISGLPRDASTLNAWMQSICDEDRPGAELAWRRVVEEKTAVTHEFRFKGSRELMDGQLVDVWALMSAYPERDESGGLKSIFGCITDISQQKWAEDFQKQRRDEAVELKRQQENFIDITSHEMRNPLSAILQCADEISSGLTRYKREDPSANAPGSLNLLIDNCVEAASIISLCANHQKRIVDDILTLSKLDSNLLLVTPVDVQPVQVVQDVLKMFETELLTNGIDSQLIIEQSYRDLAVDWVKLDPSRLRQVLINLMTNAIKFTQGRPTRSIAISLGASKDVVEDEEGLSYVPAQQPDQGDIRDDADWADGEKINLHVAITDTGSGMDDHEKQLLFQRFSQTSPRTHVQYGGSGLGLFICRILTELQGGQIAVQSEKGQGSTFAFYVKGRKSVPPRVHSPVRTPSPPDNYATFPCPLHTTPMEPLPPPTQPAITPINEPTQPQPAAAAAPSPPRQPPPPRIDVLIVEDNLVNQKVLQRQLQLSGSNTHVANHGGEALAQLRRSRFWDKHAAAPEDRHYGDGCGGNANISVILMDLEMPVMDGISCTREIRRLEAQGVIAQHIPIIAVTAYARPEQVANAKAAGVDDVISKPFRIAELIPKIEELVVKYTTTAAEPSP
ncbi:beebe2d5-08c2-455b-abdd-f494c907cdc7 [Thermothielavioides terrestris]|uniref:Beebe2d5-08c2-455b-abdd-f494c907cdc7 n=1 Tax=Thermothielavioides terrestris TaxID=2587410 RepID=A0A3S4AHY4_9PEZI|nr:beebe2d5-08c2-455b-abdd-f494c907cdc7 [Thermothielavioides terrestris]